jgi:hypothetical protein
MGYVTKISTGILLLAGIGAAISVGGCTPSSGPDPAAHATASSPVPADWPKLPEGAGCTTDLVRFQTILKSDVEKGYINGPVYDEMAPELRTAADACAEGRDAQSRKLLVATKKRYGYRP